MGINWLSLKSMFKMLLPRHMFDMQLLVCLLFERKTALAVEHLVSQLFERKTAFCVVQIYKCLVRFLLIKRKK